MSQQEIAIVLMVLGGMASAANWFTIYQTWRTGRFCSAVPFVGALFMGGGMLLPPGTRPYAWLALVMDYGTLMFLIALPLLLAEVWSTSRFNLLEEYQGQQGDLNVQLRLYRRDMFTITRTLGKLQVGNCGTWKREGGRLLLLFGSETAICESRPGRTDIMWVSDAFDDGELSLKGIELRTVSRRED